MPESRRRSRLSSAFRRFVPIVLLGLFSIGTVSAQQVTPSHVNQVVETLIVELELLHEENFSEPDLSGADLNISARLPRHVLQKAREVFLKVQLLRSINGLPPRTLPPVAVREVKPSDVRQMVDNILKDARELRLVFGVRVEAEEVALKPDQKPTDVYRSLIRAGAMIDQLGVPKTVPNDVHRVALTINGEIELIRAKRGVTVSVPAGEPTRGMSPGDVYAGGFVLLNSLKSLVERDPDYRIPGGIVLPTRKKGSITPGDVLDLLNNILAELSAVKAKIGAITPTDLVAAPSGKTPSDVFDALVRAVALVDTIKASAPIN